MNFGVAACLGLAALFVSSCTSTPAQEVRSPKAQKDLAEELAGRTPGSPVSCLPS